MKLKLALLCAIGLASANAMACYTVYDSANQVVYNAQTAPVDMSRPLHETVPVAFPGGTMVFDLGTDCPREAPAARPAPLLTDRRTAAAMHVPHTILPSGVALIEQPPVAAVVPVVTASRSQRPETVITELHNPPLTVVQQGAMVVSESR
jgi:hypothetical protein